jgi:hypothetical protein
MEFLQADGIGCGGWDNRHGGIRRSVQQFTRSLQQTYEPYIGLDGYDFAVVASAVRGRKSEEPDISPNIPNNISRLDQFLGHLKQDGVPNPQIAAVEAKAGVWRNKYLVSAELRRQSSLQNHAPAQSFGNCS